MTLRMAVGSTSAVKGSTDATETAKRGRRRVGPQEAERERAEQREQHESDLQIPAVAPAVVPGLGQSLGGGRHADQPTATAGAGGTVASRRGHAAAPERQ